MARSFKVIQNGADTSYGKEPTYNLLTRQSTKPSFSTKHFTPGKKTQPKRAAPVASKPASIFKSWSQPCPCTRDATLAKMVEAPVGHFNCVNCGALAIEVEQAAGGDSDQQQWQPVYVSGTAIDRTWVTITLIGTQTREGQAEVRSCTATNY